MPGQTSDYLGFDLVMDNNQPQPSFLLADRGYDSDKVRETKEVRNVVPVIPMRKSRKLGVAVDRTLSAPLTRAIAFFDNHTIGLSHLVEAIGREHLGKALDEAIAAIAGSAPNAERAAHAVSTLRDALADVRVAAFDEVATKTSVVWDPYTTLTWYGARLSDLAAGLCAADGSPS